MKLKIATIDIDNNIIITKVKPWAITFKCYNKKYLLHESFDDFITVTLYDKDTMEVIHFEYMVLPSCIKYKTKNGNTYSMIDKQYFVNKLKDFIEVI